MNSRHLPIHRRLLSFHKLSCLVFIVLDYIRTFLDKYTVFFEHLPLIFHSLPPLLCLPPPVSPLCNVEVQEAQPSEGKMAGSLSHLSSPLTQGAGVLLAAVILPLCKTIDLAVNGALSTSWVGELSSKFRD